MGQGSAGGRASREAVADRSALTARLGDLLESAE